MPISITLPQFREGISTKDHLISLLADESPLSTKELHARLLKNHSAEISYQAVHKILKQLESEGVIESNGRKYLLSEQWMQDVKNFAEHLQEKNNNSGKLSAITPDFEGATKIIYDDISDFCTSIATLLKRLVNPKRKEKPLIGMLRHCWWPLKFNFKDFFTLHEMTAAMNGGTAISYFASPLDKWVKEQYLRSGFKTVRIGYGPEKYPGEDVVVYSDFVIKVKFSDETLKIMDPLYERISNLPELFKEYTKKSISQQKMRIELSIIRDSTLARVLREHMEKIIFN